MKKRIYKNLNCKNCQNIFIPSSSSNKFCSNRCSRIYKNLPLFCQNLKCNKGNNQKQKELCGQQKNYCSYQCSNYYTKLNKISPKRNKTYEELYGIKKSEKIKNDLSLKLKGRKQSDEHIANRSKAMKNIIRTEEHQTNLTNAIKNSKKHKEAMMRHNKSKKMRQVSRITMAKRILEFGDIKIGKNEKELLDQQEQINNCKIERQFNTGIGYFVDGYDKENNTVYEVYENKHRRQIEKDLQRQYEIQNHLNCNFKIICDKTH